MKPKIPKELISDICSMITNLAGYANYCSGKDLVRIERIILDLEVLLSEDKE